MVDRFELEQDIMKCWNVTDDLDIVVKHVMETEKLDRDMLANMLLGMKDLYHLKFEKCFNTFEAMIRNREI